MLNTNMLISIVKNNGPNFFPTLYDGNLEVTVCFSIRRLQILEKRLVLFFFSWKSLKSKIETEKYCTRII